jgi:hypothetical protein
MLRAIALLAVMTAALAALAGPAHARAPKRSDFRFVLPPAGDVSVLAIRLTLRSPTPIAFPRKARLRIPGRRRMGDDVRVLTAHRVTRTRRSVTVTALVFAIRKAGGTPRARAAGRREDLVDMILFGAYDPCRRCGDDLPIEELIAHDHLCEKCEHAEAAVRSFKLGALSTLEADALEVLRTPFVAPLFDGSGLESGVDTGHYDDGHAFGWGGPSKVEQALSDMIGNIWEPRPKEIVPTLELDIAADLNGDGVIGPGEPQLDTTVGPPVISGGEPTQQP